MKSVSWSAVSAVAGAVSALAAVIALGPANCNKVEPAKQVQNADSSRSIVVQVANGTDVGSGNAVAGQGVNDNHSIVVEGSINAPSAVGTNNQVTVQRIDQLTEQGE